jgi:hypothetical protein
MDQLTLHKHLPLGRCKLLVLFVRCCIAIGQLHVAHNLHDSSSSSSSSRLGSHSAGKPPGTCLPDRELDGELHGYHHGKFHTDFMTMTHVVAVMVNITGSIMVNIMVKLC